MRVVIATLYSPNYDELASITIPCFQQYANKHKYDLSILKIENTNGGEYSTIKLKKTLLLLEDYDIVFFIDIDALITNPEIKIESFLEDGKDFYVCYDINGLNGGVYIFRSTRWAKEWLKYILSSPESKGDEQNFMQQNIYFNWVKILTHPYSINSIPYDYYAPDWGSINKTQKEKPTHEQGCWEKGDFVMHLPGLSLEQRISIINKTLNEING